MSDEKELDNLSLPDPFLEQTSPSVLEFEESEGDLEQTLDEILGDEEINIEAVELTEREKAELQTTPAQSVDELFADDEELEIEFEDQGELESEISNILSTIQTSDNSAQIKKLKLLLADSFGLELSAPLQPGELEKDIEEILTSAPPSADIPLSESEEELQELEALLSDDSFLQECDSEYVELDSLIESNAEENNDSLDTEPTELLGENEPQASASELTNNVNALESLDNELDMLLEKASCQNTYNQSKR